MKLTIWGADWGRDITVTPAVWQQLREALQLTAAELAGDITIQVEAD